MAHSVQWGGIIGVTAREDRRWGRRVVKRHNHGINDEDGQPGTAQVCEPSHEVGQKREAEG